MKLVFSFLAPVLLVSIITATAFLPYANPTGLFFYIEIEGRKLLVSENKCAICTKILLDPTWTQKEAQEHRRFLLTKKTIRNEVYGLHLLCLGRDRDQSLLGRYENEVSELQFKRLVKNAFKHIIAVFTGKEASDVWNQYLEVCSWMQEQDVKNTIAPLCKPKNLQKLKELLEMLIAGKVSQSAPVIAILKNLTTAKMKRAAKRPVPANLKGGNPECSTAQAPKDSDGGLQHGKRGAHRASPYPPTSAQVRMHPTDTQVPQPINSGISAPGAVEERSLIFLPTYPVILVGLSDFPAVPTGQLSHPEEPHEAAQARRITCYNSLISLRLAKSLTPAMLRSTISLVFRSEAYMFDQKYDFLIFILDYQHQFEDKKITEAIFLDLIKDYTDIYNDILLRFAFNDYRVYKMKFSPPTINIIVDHYVASSSFNSIVLIDLISILTESVDRQSEGFEQLERLFDPQKYKAAHPSHHELSGNVFSILLRCYKSMSPATYRQRGRRRLLREFSSSTQEFIMNRRKGEVLCMIYLMKFVSSNTRTTKLLCLNLIMQITDPEYRVTLYELFMPKDSLNDREFLRNLVKTDSNSAVRRFLKILAGRNYFPVSSFMPMIFYLKISQHSNLTFYFARLMANHYAWIVHEQAQEYQNTPEYRLQSLKRMREYYTALCLERYFSRIPEYADWITENIAEIIETTPADQWVLRMSYLSTSQCERVVNAYYQHTHLLILKCYENVKEVQEQEDFLIDLLNEGVQRNAFRAVF